MSSKPAIHLAAEGNMNLQLIRVMGLSAEFQDAAEFPGRGQYRDGVWRFPEGGMMGPS